MFLYLANAFIVLVIALLLYNWNDFARTVVNGFVVTKSEPALIKGQVVSVVTIMF